jgi:hypothetical protein
MADESGVNYEAGLCKDLQNAKNIFIKASKTVKRNVQKGLEWPESEMVGYVTTCLYFIL